MNKLTADKCREQFEAWASNDGTFPRAIEKRDGEYILLATQSQWTTWQASRVALEIATPILEQQERGEGWIEWGGIDGCPVGDDVSFVEVERRVGITEKIIPGDYSWLHYGSPYDIIAYRIIPEQPANQNGEQ